MSELTKRVNIMMTHDMDEKIDTMAKKLGLNKSSMIRVLINQALQQDEAINFLKDFDFEGLMKKLDGEKHEWFKWKNYDY